MSSFPLSPNERLILSALVSAPTGAPNAPAPLAAIAAATGLSADEAFAVLDGMVSLDLVACSADRQGRALYAAAAAGLARLPGPG